MLYGSTLCKCIRYSYLVLAALTACGSLSAKEESPAKTLTKDQARERVAAFIGDEKMGKVRYVDRMPSRVSFAPFTPIHLFELTTDVADEKADEKGEFLKIAITVEEGTGRILDYIPDTMYSLTKWKARPEPEESQLISPDKAGEIALGILEKAGVAGDGMRVRHHRLSTPLGRYYRYEWACSKWRDIPEVGEVEMPVIALLHIDALTGELESYIYKEWPLTTKLEAPRISRDQAIDLVKQTNVLASVSEVVDAHLCVEYDIHDLTRDQKMKQLTGPGYQFYEEFQKTRQVLAWSVKLKGRYSDPFRTKEATLHAMVDASTGLVFWHSEMSWY